MGPIQTSKSYGEFSCLLTNKNPNSILYPVIYVIGAFYHTLHGQHFAMILLNSNSKIPHNQIEIQQNQSNQQENSTKNDSLITFQIKKDALIPCFPVPSTTEKALLTRML